MRRAHLILILAGACLAIAHQASAVVLEGYPVPDSVSVDGRTLVLNGAAVRRFSIYKVEVASLYVPNRQATIEGVTAQAGPKRLQLVMLRDTRSDDITKKFMSDFRSVSSPAEWNHLLAEMAALGGMLNTGTKKGDVVTVDWVPDGGLVVSKNGKPLAD